MSDGVEVTSNGGIAEVVIDRPPVNALARDTYRRIKEVFDSFADAPDVRAVILTGAGTKAFCAGRDIKDLQVERAEANQSRVPDPYSPPREPFCSPLHSALPF